MYIVFLWAGGSEKITGDATNLQSRNSITPRNLMTP